MSNRRKVTTTKLPAPTEAQAIAHFAKMAETNSEVVVPTSLSRRQLRSMRAKVPVIRILEPALQHVSTHQHDPSCIHATKEN